MRARLAAAAPSAPVEARDSEGRTALMLAVLQGHRDEVVALLRQGADANAADFAGVTPLQAARANHLPAIADALVQAGAR
jgi:ankyrin repeat protein